jgi:hypothetical protein
MLYAKRSKTQIGLMKNRQLRTRVILLIFLRHIMHDTTPLELTLVGLLLARAHFEGVEPVDHPVAHGVPEPAHEVCVPRVFEGFGLHDNVGAF